MLMTCPKCGQLTKGQTGDQCPKCKIFLRPAAEMGELQQRRERREDEPPVGAERDTVTRKCPKCGAVEATKEAKFCSRCGAALKTEVAPSQNAKKNTSGAGILWVVIIFLVLGAIGSHSKSEMKRQASSYYSPPSTYSYSPSSGGTTYTSPSSGTTNSGATAGERNALKSAKSYINYGTGLSYSGLIDQLEFEGYSHSEAVYGADNCGASWKQQAVKCATAYLKYSSFSRSGLIDQLEFDGFTHEQAVYGAEQNGY